MSKLKDLVDSSITDLEVQSVLRVIATKEIKRERVHTALGDVLCDIEKTNKTCKAIIMSAGDYQVMRKHLRQELEIETEAAVLSTGKMATYYGAEIRVFKGFEDGMVGVPNVPEADGALIVLKEVAL
jgi:hypothetical protein